MIRFLFSALLIYWIFRAVSNLFSAVQPKKSTAQSASTQKSARKNFKSKKKQMENELSEDVSFEEL